LVAEVLLQQAHLVQEVAVPTHPLQAPLQLQLAAEALDPVMVVLADYLVGLVVVVVAELVLLAQDLALQVKEIMAVQDMIQVAIQPVAVAVAMLVEELMEATCKAVTVEMDTQVA
jgi:hypothetical protein